MPTSTNGQTKGEELVGNISHKKQAREESPEQRMEINP